MFMFVFYRMCTNARLIGQCKPPARPVVVITEMIAMKRKFETSK